MSFILDITVIVTIALCVYSGIRKGAVRVIITIAGYILAFIIATFVSGAFSEPIYKNAVKTYVMSALETKASEIADEYLSTEKFGEMLYENGITLTDEQLASVIENGDEFEKILSNEKLRDTVNKTFTAYCEKLTEAFSGIVPDEIIEEAELYIENAGIKNKLFSDDKNFIVEIVETEIVRPVIIVTIKAILFSLSFIIVMAVVSVVSRMSNVVKKIPIVNSANGFLGGILGFCRGILFIMVLSVGISVFIKLTSGTNTLINRDVISRTWLFDSLYNGTFFILSLIL